MRLTRVEIRHFRSLYSVDLDLKPLTLIIGPNGSGKSNLFKALRFLQTGVAGDVQEWRAYDAQTDDLVWYGKGPAGVRPDDIRLSLSFGKGDPSTELAEYRARFETSGAIQIAEESLEVKAFDGEWKTFLRRTGGEVLLPADFPQLRFSIPLGPLSARSTGDLALRDFGPGLQQAAPKAVYQHVSGWKLFEINPWLARKSSYISPDPDEVPPLDSDASNLSAFLYALSRLRPDDLEAVTEAVRRSIELPQDILIEHDAERGGKQARYRFIENAFGAGRPIPAESMSDGTIRLLAHMALLLADETASLVCLEEPDNGLHPRLMLHLADALRQSVDVLNSETLYRQVLVVTHSPELMDCFDLREERDYLQVYIAERDGDGRTVFTPMTAQEFAPWLEKYRLGEAVRRHFV